MCIRDRYNSYISDSALHYINENILIATRLNNRQWINSCLLYTSRWGYKLSEYANLWGHDTFTNTEFIFVLGTQASNTFEPYNYPVGVENGNSGNVDKSSAE